LTAWVYLFTTFILCNAGSSSAPRIGPSGSQEAQGNGVENRKEKQMKKIIGVASSRRGNELPKPADSDGAVIVSAALDAVSGKVGKSKVKKTEPQQLVKLQLGKIHVHIISQTGLIVHEFSAKSKKEMLDNMMKVPKKGREARDPLADFKGSLYKFPEGGPLEGKFGFPARGFKACFVNAANDVELQKTQIKRQLRVHGTGEGAMNVDALILIEADELPKALWTEWDHKYAKELAAYHKMGISMREDVVRLANGNADLRYRAIYPNWRAKVPVVYNSRMLSRDQLLALIDAAGFGVGIGEWRPGAPQSQSGQFGCFVVDTSKPIEGMENLDNLEV